MEATFQKIVLTIAIVLLIILLIVINMSLSTASSSKLWPPITTMCPDYWEDISGNGAQCVNVKNIGTCFNIDPKFDANGSILPNKSMNFNIQQFTGSGGICSKQKWANTCGVAWDGITYGYGAKNPCDKKNPI